LFAESIVDSREGVLEVDCIGIDPGGHPISELELQPEVRLDGRGRCRRGLAAGAIAATFSGVFEHRDNLPFRIKITRSPI
jgi:hypothetical protein